MSLKKKQPTVFLCKSFEKERFSVTDIDKGNDRVTGQWMAYPRYDYAGKGENTCVFQTPEIKLTQYGLPSIGEYYKEDSQRTFVKVPFDPSQDGCDVLKNMLSQIDEHLQDEKFLKTIFGKKQWKSFTYQPMVREPQEQEEELGSDEDSEEEVASKAKKGDGEKADRFDYCKVKLDVSWGSGELETKFFVKEAGEDGKKKRPEEVKCKTVSELDNYLTWGSTIRMMVMVNKFWAQKTKQNGTKSYGVTMKALQIVITPSESRGSLKKDFEKYAFIDEDGEYDDSEDSEDDETLSSESSGKKKKASAKEANELDGSDEEDEEDAESEEDEEDAASEEDEEDEDDEASEEESEESEEEIKPKKVVKKATKKAATKAKPTAKKTARAKKSSSKNAKA